MEFAPKHLPLNARRTKLYTRLAHPGIKALLSVGVLSVRAEPAQVR